MTPSKKEFLKKKRSIERREKTLEFDKEALLRNKGWEYTSNFPDSYWRWRKIINGVSFTTMNPDEALRMEEVSRD